MGTTQIRLDTQSQDATLTSAKIETASVTAAKLASGAAVSNIGYTPVNKAGDSITGALLISDGTLSAPGIAFSAETNSGIFRAAANNFVITNGGANSLQFDSGNFQVFGTPGVNAFAISPDLGTAMVVPSLSPQTSSFNPFTAVGEVFPCDATGGAITVSLPDITVVSPYRFTFKKTDVSANNVVITAFTAQTIDGAATFTLSAQYSSVTIVADPSVPGWWVIAKV